MLRKVSRSGLSASYFSHFPLRNFLKFPKIGRKRVKPERFPIFDFPEAPFGKYPVLKIDDIEIAQSAAINRYLARQFGFAGKNPIEEAQADSYIDQCQEYNTSFRACMYATLQGKPEEEVQKIREEVYIPAQNKFYEIFSDILNRNKSGFLVGDSLTWADLVIADHLYSLDTMGMLTHEDAWRCETLKKFQEKIYEHPLLKGYIASRPKGAF